MATKKEAMIPSSQAEAECCMCGDCGISYELFQCRICQFRSQHRYCSNLYPKAESYQVCNWCLSHDNSNSKEKSQNSSNSSSSNKNNSEDDNSKGSKKRNINKSTDNPHHQGGLLKSQRSITLQLQVNNTTSPIKKLHKSPERSPSTRRRIITNAKLEEKLIRRTKSDDISNKNGITKQVFRNKVRRYKLLEEVSS